MIVASHLRRVVCTSRVTSTRVKWNSTTAAQVSEATLTPVSVIPDPSILGYPVWAYQTLIDSAQTLSGGPWWAILIGTGFLSRSLLLPFNIKYEKKLLKSIPFSRQLQQYHVEFEKLRQRGDLVGAMVKRKEMQLYKKEVKYRSPLWYIIPSISFAVLNFSSIRGLSNLPYLPLQEASLLWCTSLTASDPYLILPTLNSALTIYVIKYGIDLGSNPIMEKMLKSPFAVWLAFSLMLGCQSLFPSSLVIYWLSSNVVGTTLIGPALRNDTFRGMVGLPTMAAKKEQMSQMLTLDDLTKQNREAYNSVREEGHRVEMENRKARLEHLEEKNASDNERIAQLEEELERESEKLQRVKKNLEDNVKSYQARLENLVNSSTDSENKKSDKL